MVKRRKRTAKKRPAQSLPYPPHHIPAELTQERSFTVVRGQNRFTPVIDPLHAKVAWFGQSLVQEVWADKYRHHGEDNPSDTFARVAQAIYINDDPDRAQEAFEAMDAGLWMPGGRIIAGAGTAKRVTLMNCYVNRKLEDSLDEIMQGVSVAALTQQQGGGIGTDFSTLRPSGAVLRRTGARASGPLPFMDMWHSMCSTIMSAGDRRGAMMGTLCDTHPDLPQFILAKQTKDRLTNFNISVLVSDAFMEAIREDEDWVLHFNVPPQNRELNLAEYDFYDEQTDGPQYAYSVWKARDLWELIVKNTYEWSEPGIIFIDRVNTLNNLQYCEEIHCTNPCGEQPLPPNGTCNLGAINLSKLVKRPFLETAEINWELLSHIAKLGMRFLDNVIDCTNYPLPEQREEEFSKRRTGLGVSGLADMLAQLGLRYGSAEAVRLTEKVFQHICLAAYESSMDLAIERGAFPNFDKTQYLKGFAGQNLSDEYKTRMRHVGMRNGVLLTVAPTGTTSILYGNISSGIEPIFAHTLRRKVRQADNSFKEYDVHGYNTLLYHSFTNSPVGSETLPSYMVTCEELTIEDHITMQAAVQRWVDASVSKTINVAQRTTFAEFQKVYNLAYALGCKGCTTYRPSDVRGSILSLIPSTEIEPKAELAKRHDTLLGRTHKVKWPSMSSALYITVNYNQEGRPFEVFFNSKDARSQEWMTALSLMISAILRKGGNIEFIGEELAAVRSIHDTAWIKTSPADEKPRFFGSLLAYIGFILGRDFTAQKDAGAFKPTLTTVEVWHMLEAETPKEKCPQCFAPAINHIEGCKTCANCGFSDCN